MAVDRNLAQVPANFLGDAEQYLFFDAIRKVAAAPLVADIANVSPNPDQILYFDTDGLLAQSPVTALSRSLIGLSSQAAWRSGLGLGTLSTRNTVGTAQIDNAAVTLAKLANMATDSLIGRDTAASGAPEIIAVGGGLEMTGSLALQRSALTGDISASVGSNTTAIGANKVLNTMLRDSAALSVIGRSANSSGDPGDIAAANDGEVLQRAGSTLVFAAVGTATITANSVTDAKLRQSVGLSVIGRAANTTGDVADITAANDGEVLRRSGTGLGFGQIATAGLANDAVTFAKFQNITDARLLGRSAGSSGDMQEITVGTGLSLAGGALTSTITQYTDEMAEDALASIVTDTATVSWSYNDAANTLAASVIDNAVSNAKLRQSAGLSIVGRSANSTGNVADITAGTDGHVLRLSGTTLAFGQIAIGAIPDDLITYAKMQNVSATSRLLGRKTASAGDTEECTLSEALDFIGSAAQGDLLYRGASAWARLGAGTATNVLKTGGASANPAWAAVAESELTFTDITTNNVSTTKHGFTPKLPNDATKFLDGTGAYSTPSGSGGNKLAQIVSTITGTMATGTTLIPLDNTIPQNTEGDQYMSLAITPTNASSQLVIQVVAVASPNSANGLIMALFQDSTANALASVVEYNAVLGAAYALKLNYVMTAGTTSATTFKVRIGALAGIPTTVTFNGFASTAFLGGTIASSIIITEKLP